MMIDLKDEKQRYYYLEKCITRKPIDFYGLKIYHPIIDDIFEMGEDSYKELLMPFILSNEYLKLPNIVSLLEDIYLSDDYMRELLIISLSYFMKLERNDFKVFRPESKNGIKGKIIIKDTLIINDEKFNELKILIQMICNVPELTKADLESLNNDKPISESKKKLLEGRKKSKTTKIEEKRMKLVNVYDYIVHKPPMPDYDRYLDWSIYQLYNTYTNMIQKENIQFTYDVITNGMGTKDMKLESLAEKIIK